MDYDIVFNKRRIVNYDSNYDIYNIGDDQGAIQIIDKMFEEEYLPEGIVAINDSLAIKMINELHNRGIHVPNDISIVGKCSLQGTTQGRYLTGGVPPVRFSM